MNRIRILLIILLVGTSLFAQTRQPAVAGSWYPADAEQLKQMLAGLFDDISHDQPISPPLGLISPHAGFIYSGNVAAQGFSLLADKQLDTIILLGSSHHYLDDVVSIYNGDSAATPLGRIPIDKEISQTLIAADTRFVFWPKIHQPEHSLEAQLPFLQFLLEDFKVVLILTSTNDFKLLDKLASVLTDIARQTTKQLLFINSTDMSHFHDYQSACRMDQKTISLIIGQDYDQLHKNMISRASELCGYHALYPFLQIMQNLKTENPVLLKYANSGDAVGDTQSTRVVGYCSIVFPPKNLEKKREESNMKNEDKKYLLNLARESIQYYLRNGVKLKTQPPENAELKEERAVFVTLNKNDNLRGCIGHMEARMPLYEAVIEMAVEAAFEDPRFASVSSTEELNQIKIEISVLSPMKRIYDYKKIRLGIDGVWLRKSFRSGVFLPQVADETGWDLDTFLGNLCAGKAGLPYDAYKDADTEIYIYQVQKFQEE